MNEKNENHYQAEMEEDELNQVVGGSNADTIQVCNVCNRRIAVSGMEICASCFREQN